MKSASLSRRRTPNRFRALLAVEHLEERASPTDAGYTAAALFADPRDTALLGDPALTAGAPTRPQFVPELLQSHEIVLPPSPQPTGDAPTAPATRVPATPPAPTAAPPALDADSLFRAALDGNDLFAGPFGAGRATPRDPGAAPAGALPPAPEAGAAAPPGAAGAPDAPAAAPSPLTGNGDSGHNQGVDEALAGQTSGSATAGSAGPAMNPPTTAPDNLSPPPAPFAGSLSPQGGAPAGPGPWVASAPAGMAGTALAPSAAHAHGILAVGADAGSPPLVTVYDAVTRQEKFHFLAYDSSFRGGVRVAVGDVNGDGVPDIITAPGPGGGSRVRAFDGRNGKPLAGRLGGFDAFPRDFTDGAFVAAGDVNGDGKADIIVGTDRGSTSPQANVFSGADGRLLFSVMGDVAGFHGGVRVAAGDVNGDGKADVITADGPGGAPRVCVFDGVTHKEVYNFFAADPTYRGGLYVASADLEGTGKADIVTGAGTGSEVRVFRGSDSTPITRFNAFDASFQGGVRVATADAEGDGAPDVVAAQGPGGGQVRLFDGKTMKALASFSPDGPGYRGGLFVGGDGNALVLTPPPDPPLPTVTITATTPDTSDAAGAAYGIFQVTRTGDTSGGLTVQLAVGGTATVTTDYTFFGTFFTYGGSGTGTGFFPPGAATGAIGIVPRYRPTDDGLFEGLETVVFTITSDPAYNVGTPSQAVVTIHDTNGPAPLVPDSAGCACGAGGDLVGQAGGLPHSGAGGASASGVRYADGTVKVASTDLSSSGFGTPWGDARSWTNGAGYAATTFGGNGTVVSQVPYLLRDGSGTIAEVSNGTTARFFDPNGGNYTPRFFLQESLTYNAAAGQFTLTDTAGDRLAFWDFSSGRPANQRGQLASLTDPAGNVTAVTSWTSDGKPAEVQRSNTTGGVTTVESYLDTYLTSGANTGRLSNEALRRQVNGGAWSTVRQTDYTYYDGTTSNGNLGDLKTAVVKDASGNALDTSYYRYYTANTSTGYQGGLKYAFTAQSYARLVAALGSNVDSLTDAQVAPYADSYFEYDSVQRVTKATTQGSGCSVCTGGLGTSTYAYTTSAFPDGYNNWRTKTVETLPDGNQNIVYTNFAGEVMLSVFKDTTSGNAWDTFNKYDNSGRLILTANPSAVTGYDDTRPDLLNNQSGSYQYLSNSSGLIQLTDYLHFARFPPT